ncbi:N-acetylmuramoyl-L-alanine amidase [Lachnospiraceae bacterium KM106-2]|nr:N-acetylmuramoyl-L-alanine amidase [Lachnospiraceae bacterium KM106-2]
MAYKIYIDAGHGGYDMGASYNGRYEKDDNLNLAKAVGKELEDMGYEVGYTRSTDVYQSPNEKAEIANDNNADLFISIHRNTSPVPNTYQGVEILVFNKGDLKEDMAKKIADNLADVGFSNLGVDARKNLAVLRKTKMPALLIDVGFINTDYDNQLFDGNFERIVMAIAQGIDDAINQEQESEVKLSYRVQVGLFKNYNNAENLQELLVEKGYPAEIVELGGLSAVLVGSYATVQEAQRMEDELASAGYESIVIAL